MPILAKRASQPGRVGEAGTPSRRHRKRRLRAGIAATSANFLHPTTISERQKSRQRQAEAWHWKTMRTIWNGSISFGLVNIPVGMALATKPAARQSDVSFRMLHRECGTPIKNKRWCPQHDREVSNDEIVKGWEVAKGQFVIVEDADLEALETADDTRTIAITRFVELDQVDPIFFDRTYFLAPADAPAQRRPYVLLLEAMKETNTAAVGTFVRQGAEHFCLIRPKGNALALETLFLAEDVRSQVEIEEAVAGTEVKQPELELAGQVMQSLVGEFDPAELHSEYRQDLRAMLEAKLAGQEVSKPAPIPETPVVDLMEALRRSVAEAQGRKQTAAAPSKKRAAPKSGSSKPRRAPARKSA
jgi:DNA end-binding protein Ku